MKGSTFVGRSEYKYYIPYTDACLLMTQLSQIMTLDEHSAKGSYRVKSLYFDSNSNRDYFEKMGGYQERKKIRLRIYDEDSAYAKLEMKSKIGSYQHKYSVMLSREMAQRIAEGEYDILLDQEEPVAHTIYSILRLENYRPVVIVEYERRAFVYDNFNTRITFDCNIQSEEVRLDLFDKNLSYTSIMKEYVVLEVKFDQHLAGFIQKALAPYSLNNVAISKYCIGRRSMAQSFVL